ncbi:DUF2275 domain-containing protein [Mycobacterium botniense]|uniref:Zinc-finger domain-containing protein n=1 Tax=Mycobacterium botniense TaxID=84962 RepID=A0A7I9Y1Z0_9MYCO|nr:DUF2275 domain-containing protein [Mycobacterium botniense]GFG76092.1 hypothetical protein MBOT_34570 [Mycobacterium botniense]
MDCDVAREALSARLDGEREPVPPARVDEHLASCPHCRAWFADVRDQSLVLRRMTGRPKLAPAVPDTSLPRRAERAMTWRLRYWARAALAFAGLVHIMLAIAQSAGVDFGMVAGRHGTMTGAHLLNESTAWSFAVGAGMLVAAAWPRAAPGLSCVLAVFAVVLVGYVISDDLSGQVTTVRVLSHLPVWAATVLAFLVWFFDSPDRVPGRARADEEGGITLPDRAARGRRRGHLRPTDDSAA